MQVRKGYHHVHLPILILFVLLTTFVVYRVVVTSNFWSSLCETVQGALPTFPREGRYLIRLVPENGKEEQFYVEGKIKVEERRLVIRQNGQTIYYPIQPNTQVIITEVR
jgi:hypothetical protein